MRAAIWAAMAGVAALAVATATRADVLTYAGTPRVLGQGYNGFLISYTFAPIDIPGEITGVQITFDGQVTPAVGGARYSDPGATISSVTVTPMASFANNLWPGSNAIPLPGAFVKGTAETLLYDDHGNTSYGAAAQHLTVTTSAGAGFPADAFAAPSVELVDLFTDPLSFRYTDPEGAYFPTENVSRTTGYGSMTLVITYTAVPEPWSLALLGVGLLGLAGWRRHRSATPY